MRETQKSSKTGPVHSTLRRATRRAVERLRRGRADERGLTTLEWLLIVAAVAGLAALAVVLVQNVVDDTAEQIGGSSARGTAARVAAERITREARAALPVGDNTTALTDTLGPVTAWVILQNSANERYAAACDRLEINYSDIPGFESDWAQVAVAVLSAGTATPVVADDSFTAGNQGTTSTHDSGSAAVTGDARTEAVCEVALAGG